MNNSKRLKGKTFTKEKIKKAEELENALISWYQEQIVFNYLFFYVINNA